MDAKEVLIEVKKVLEKGWCQKSTAVSEKGNAVKPNGKVAVKWCLYGGLCRVRANTTGDIDGADMIMTRVCQDLGYGNIVAYNDKPARTQEEILDFMDICISRASEVV
jgi:hypothetical protein